MAITRKDELMKISDRIKEIEGMQKLAKEDPLLALWAYIPFKAKMKAAEELERELELLKHVKVITAKDKRKAPEADSRAI